MIKKMNEIKKSNHPFSEEMGITIARIEGGLNFLLFIILAAGFLIAVIGAIVVGEQLGNPRGVATFFCIILFSLLCSIPIYYIKMLITAILKAKMHMLDSLYRSEKMTELYMGMSCHSQNEASDSRKP